MKLLITGATGFAGGALLDLLSETQNYTRISTLVLPNDPGEARLDNGKLPGLRILHADITDSEAVRRSVAGHTHVVHLAGLISYWKRDRAALTAVNQSGVENIVDACLLHGVRRLIHVSSVGAIGFHRDGQPADEQTAYNWPNGFPYMSTKRAGQEVVERAVAERKLPAVILNPASLMGPGDPDPATPHNQLYHRIRNKTLFGCFAGGLAVTDVRDLAQIILKALEHDAVGERYLVVGANIEYRRVVEAIGSYYSRKVYPFRVPAFVLAAAGSAMETLSAITGKRPLLTYGYGRLSGWFGYYSNAKSRRAFGHQYLPFEKTIADACAYYESEFC